MKRCSRCDKEKPLTTEFYHRCSKHSTGLKSDCKECRNEINRIRQGSQKRKEVKKYNASVITDHKAYHKEYYKKNREKYREYYKKNKEKILAYQKEYYIKNDGKEKSRLKKNKRDAMKKSLLHTLKKDEWERCLKEFHNECAYCGIETIEIQQDHFVPISKGGEYTRWNIVPSCKDCNLSKRAENFETWYKRQNFYDPRKERKILRYLNYKNRQQQISMF